MTGYKCHKIRFYNSTWDKLLKPVGSAGAWIGSGDIRAFISCWRGKLALILSRVGE